MRNGDDEYAKAHIPGAVHARWDTDLADPERPDLWMLAGPDRFADAMASRGIGDDTFVVTYDDQHVTVAARVWWALRVYGHAGVAVLDGGDQQMAGRRPVHHKRRVQLSAGPLHAPVQSGPLHHSPADEGRP